MCARVCVLVHRCTRNAFQTLAAWKHIILNRDGYSCFPVFIIPIRRVNKIYGHVCLTYAKFERITREITYFEMMRISVICLFLMRPRDTVVTGFDVY